MSVVGATVFRGCIILMLNVILKTAYSVLTVRRIYLCILELTSRRYLKSRPLLGTLETGDDVGKNCMKFHHSAVYGSRDRTVQERVWPGRIDNHDQSISTPISAIHLAGRSAKRPDNPARIVPYLSISRDPKQRLPWKIMDQL